MCIEGEGYELVCRMADKLGGDKQIVKVVSHSQSRQKRESLRAWSTALGWVISMCEPQHLQYLTFIIRC